MNISKIAVFIAVWMIAALIGYYQDWGLVLAGSLVLPLWLLWAFSGDSRQRSGRYQSGGFGREARHRQRVKLWGVVLVVIGLLLLWWFPAAPWIINWVALGSGCLGVLCGFAMVCSGWRKMMGIFALGVVMMCFGFVPHPQYRYVAPYRAYDYSPYGMKVIEGQEKGRAGESLYGLADRYGIVVSPQYINFYLLDRHQPFLALDNGHGVGVYDLERHDLVVPFTDECAKIVVIGDKRFEMVDSAGRPFAHIELPKIYKRDVKETALKLIPLDHQTAEPEELITPSPTQKSLPVVNRRIVPVTEENDGQEIQEESEVTESEGHQ